MPTLRLASIAACLTLGAQLATAGTVTTLHSFNPYGTLDAYQPVGTLALHNGILYGQGYQGGANGNGNVYSLTTSGTQTILASYNNLWGGALPKDGLVYVNGSFWTTTYYGGFSNTQGAIVQVPLTGPANVVYSFTGGTDGSRPVNAGRPLAIGKVLYLTTQQGGANGQGTVVSYATDTGQLTVLHAFGATPGDGLQPYAALTKMGTKIYGTTQYGGTANIGTVFSMNLDGTGYTTLYSFVGAPGGAQPKGPLVPLKGRLYGMAAGGTGGGGTIYSISATGNFRQEYLFPPQFYSNPLPSNGMIVVNGVLYGMTTAGGSASAGTIFSLVPGGTPTTLYEFGTVAGLGTSPVGNLVQRNGVFYGVTFGGGSLGVGTVFQFTP